MEHFDHWITTEQHRDKGYNMEIYYCIIKHLDPVADRHIKEQHSSQWTFKYTCKTLSSCALFSTTAIEDLESSRTYLHASGEFVV